MQNEDLHCTEIRIVTKNKQKPLINALFTLISISINYTLRHIIKE